MSHRSVHHTLLALSLLATLLLAAGLGPWGARTSHASAAPYAPDEVIVQLAADGVTTIEAINAAYGTSTICEFPLVSNTYMLRAPAGEDVAALLARMSDDPRIAFAEPNYVSGTLEARPRKIGAWGGMTAEPRFDQYAVEQLGLPRAHAISRGAAVTVAVIDTGVQLDHPALAANLLPGIDLIDHDGLAEDEAGGLDSDGDGLLDEAYGHGSHVAGIILLVAPEARILPIRVLDSDGAGEIYNVALAIAYAIERGADVINLSLGTDLETGLLKTMVQAATRSGALVVSAAGNAGSAAREYPAADACAVAVTSLDQDQRLSPDAATGHWIDLAAPGESIYSSMHSSGYGWWSGTSMAAPFVSGQIALIAAARPELTVRQVAALTAATARELEEQEDEVSMRVRAIDIGASLERAVGEYRVSTRHSFIPLSCTAAASPVGYADDETLTTEEPAAEEPAAP